jgi:predicted phosphodiesterase
MGILFIKASGVRERSMKRTLKVYAIADIHSPDAFSMPELDPDQFDVVVTLGDIGEDTLDYISYMSRRVPQFGVPGGHDRLLPLGVGDLHGKVVTVKGIRIGGFGGAPKYADRPFHYDEREVTKQMRRMPPVDLLVTHTPPLATSMDKDPLHRGYRAFDHYIQRCTPLYLVHGHLEQNYKAQVQHTTVYGISFRRPLSLCFDKEIYPHDNHKPKRELSLYPYSWIRCWLRRRRISSA